MPNLIKKFKGKIKKKIDKLFSVSLFIVNFITLHFFHKNQ